MQDFLIKQITESISSAHKILKEKMTTFGVAERWPSLLAAVEELTGTKSLPLAQFLATKSEPLMSWINADITRFEDYQIELKMRLAPHLFVGGSWDLSVFTGSALLPIKWLLEKHTPPGQLKMHVCNLELQNDFPILEGVLFARTSITPEDVENFVNILMKNGTAIFEANVGFFSTQEKRMAQTHLNIECEWKALLQNEGE
jgi:hypothetical protein